MGDTNTSKPAPKPELKAPEPEVLTLKEKLTQQMASTSSPLRNQETPELTVDFQLMSNTSAETIVAMTGLPMSYIKARAKEIGVPLQGTLAGDLRPKN